MYGPPANCKKNWADENSLRKCIRPLNGEAFLRAHDDDSERACRVIHQAEVAVGRKCGRITREANP